MKLNLTGRRDIQKHHARVTFHDDPVGSNHGHYFEVTLELNKYELPPDARVFVEALRKKVMMRFDFGTVGTLTVLTPAQRRLADFGNEPDGVKLRVKVVQPDGPEAGKLLAEADGLVPHDGGISPLIYIAAVDLGQTPWRLDLVPTDADLPTLNINTAIGGKEYAQDPVAKPLLMTAVTREIFTALVREGEHDDEEDHWTSLWMRFATQVLDVEVPPVGAEQDESVLREWVEKAVEAFATSQHLTDSLAAHQTNLERHEIEEIN